MSNLCFQNNVNIVSLHLSGNFICTIFARPKRWNENWTQKGGWNKTPHKRNDGGKHNRFLIERKSSYILLYQEQLPLQLPPLLSQKPKTRLLRQSMLLSAFYGWQKLLFVKTLVFCLSVFLIVSRYYSQCFRLIFWLFCN